MTSYETYICKNKHVNYDTIDVEKLFVLKNCIKKYSDGKLSQICKRGFDIIIDCVGHVPDSDIKFYQLYAVLYGLRNILQTNYQTYNLYMTKENDICNIAYIAQWLDMSIFVKKTDHLEITVVVNKIKSNFLHHISNLEYFYIHNAPIDSSIVTISLSGEYINISCIDKYLYVYILKIIDNNKCQMIGSSSGYICPNLQLDIDSVYDIKYIINILNNFDITNNDNGSDETTDDDNYNE